MTKSATTALNLVKITQEVEIRATPAKVFARMTNDVAPWWDHGFSKNPKAIVLEPKVGGRFFEEFGAEDDSGGFAVYGQVMKVVPSRELVIHGPMGMSGAVHGVITFNLEAKGDATLLRLTHDIMGDVDDGTRASYDGGWRALLGGRLKPLVETGTAGGAVAPLS